MFASKHIIKRILVLVKLGGDLVEVFVDNRLPFSLSSS